MPEKLVFDQTMEGLFIRGLAGRVTPALKARLKEVGLDLDRKLLPAYSFETWCSCLRVTAKELYPDEPVERAYYSLGEWLVEGYRTTMMGRALFIVLQLLGPRRLLSRVQQSFRSGNNYTQVIINEVAPTERSMRMNEAGDSRYLVQGAISAGMHRCGVREPRVEIQDYTSEDVTFFITWREE